MKQFTTLLSITTRAMACVPTSRFQESFFVRQSLCLHKLFLNIKLVCTFLAITTLFLASCNDKQTTTAKQDSKDLASLFDNYYKERMQLIPLESTQNGDSVNNDKLYADFT